MPTPTPPNPHPDRCGECPAKWSSMEVTAMTNTTALVNPATVLSAIHSAALFASGIAANVATRTTNDVRQATVDVVRRVETVPATAPAR